MIDGVEARLGSAAFCGLAACAATSAASDAATSHDLLSASADERPCSRSARRCGRMRSKSSRRWRGAGSTFAFSRATAPRRSRRSRDALGIASMAGRPQARRQDRRHRSTEGQRPPGADGRRRPQRCAVACRRARFDVADHRRRSDAGAGRRGVPRRAAQAGAGRHRDRAPGARADDAKICGWPSIYNAIAVPVAIAGGDAADRRAGDVRLVDAGDAQCAAGARTKERVRP